MNALVSLVQRRTRSGCADAPVLRERGQREVFCGLTGIVWLHRKIQDAFFLVVGSRTCAHLIQSAAGVMIFAEPRFATAIIDERDLAGLADANEELDRVVAAPARAPARHQAAVPRRLLPVRGDQARPVARRGAAVADMLLAARARAQLFGQRHRDDVHAGRGRLPRVAGAGCCRPHAPTRQQSLLVVGALADVVEDQFAAPVRRAGHRARPLPSRLGAPTTCPPVGPSDASFLLAQPFLADTARALEERGAVGSPRRSRSAPKARRCGSRRRPAPSACRRRALSTGRRRRRPRRARAQALARHRDRARRQARLLLPRLAARGPAGALPGARAGDASSSRSARPTCTARISPRSSPCCRPARRCSAKARTSSASSTAAAPRGPISSCAASASPIRWRPRA